MFGFQAYDTSPAHGSSLLHQVALPLPTPPVYIQSSVGQEVILNFLEIFWGGRDFTKGVCSVLLSITKVLGTGGE